MTQVQEWQMEQRAIWRNLFDPYIVEEPDNEGEAKAHCPIHEDFEPSANVNLDSGVWHCFGCNKGGPIDTLYIMLTGRMAAGWVPPWVSTKEKRSYKPDAGAEALPTEEDIEEWHNDLMADPDALEYLQFTRGLRHSEIKKRSLIMRPDRSVGVKYGFPIYDENATLVNVRWYAQRNPVRGIAKRVWSVKGHGTARIFPIDIVMMPIDKVCIVEGEFDALLLNSWGVPAVTSTGGAGASSKRWKSDWNDLFENKTVYIIPDRDIPGMEFAYYVAESLAEYADRVAIVELPFAVKESHGEDVSDFLLKEDQPDIKIEALKALLRKASKDARYKELERDPKVKSLLDFYRKQEHAKSVQRREEVIESWQEPPSTFTLKEEMSLALPPFSYTVNQVHTTDSNSLLHSAYKVGKSTLLLNLMKSLADGVPFLGAYETAPVDGRVAFWNYEVSQVQFNRWIKQANIHNYDKTTVLHLRGFNLDISVREIFEWAVEWLVMREVTALVIDPYSRAFGGDENDNSAVGAWLDRVDELKREAGVKDLFMSAHHGRGFEERARGAARLEDWADSLWSLNRDGADRYFAADGRDVVVPESKLGFSTETKELSIVGGSRAYERMEAMVDLAVTIVNNHPGERTYAQLVDDLAGQGTKAERSDAVAQATEYGMIYLDHTTTPARYKPKGG